MKAPPYALTRAPDGRPPAATRQPPKGAGTRLGAARRRVPGAKPADWRSQIRGFLGYNPTAEERRFCRAALESVQTRRFPR